MIRQILELLKLDFKTENEHIFMAKGGYKYPTTFGEAVNYLKNRKWHKM
jgi:hypothetical protein